MERYKPDENDKANPQAEQDAWEADQMRRTHLKAGAVKEQAVSEMMSPSCLCGLVYTL
jgi:hypothetical protein